MKQWITKKVEGHVEDIVTNVEKVLDEAKALEEKEQYARSLFHVIGHYLMACVPWAVGFQLLAYFISSARGSELDGIWLATVGSIPMPITYVCGLCAVGFLLEKCGFEFNPNI